MCDSRPSRHAWPHRSRYSGRELNVRSGICCFFFSNAALLKTVAVRSLQTLSQKEADNYTPDQQSKPKQATTTANKTTHKTRERLQQAWRETCRKIRRETACQFTIQKPPYAQMFTSRKYHSQNNQSRSSPTLNNQLAFESNVHHHRQQSTKRCSTIEGTPALKLYRPAATCTCNAEGLIRQLKVVESSNQE